MFYFGAAARLEAGVWSLKLDIAARLKQIRGKLSQDEFSELIGVHKNSIGRYERGDSTPDMVFAQSVCTIFGVSPEWLIFGTGSMRHGGAAPVASDSPHTPGAAQENPCTRCGKLEADLEIERRERRELTAELRHLWKENSELREKCARFEERQYQYSVSHDDSSAMGSA